MSFCSRAWPGAAVAVSLYLAGCTSPTGPASLADPIATAAQAAALDSAFSAPVIGSLQSLGSSIQMAPPVVRAAFGALRAMPRAPVGSNRYAALAAMGHGFQQLVPGFAALAASGVFPDTLLGSVYTWSAGADGYRRDSTTGAPTNGVRFWLYAIDPATDEPSSPLTPIGYVNLLDETTGGTARLHIQVKSSDGTITYLDYTFSGSGSSESFAASVSGTISNGLGGAANKTLTFDVTISGSLSSATMTSTFTLNHPAITVGETLTIADDGSTTTLTINFTFTGTGETINIGGTVAISDADGSDTVGLTCKVNGGAFATVTGSSDNSKFTKAAGGQLTAGEILAIGSLVAAAADVSEKVADIFTPAQNILGF
jgi:hypothetical protein